MGIFDIFKKNSEEELVYCSHYYLRELKKDNLYENGQKKFEWNYKNVKQGDLYTEWYENGKKKRERTYKDGKEFLSNSWDENGKIIIKDGNGLYTEWYENGQKEEEYTYKDGKLDGLEIYWFENGNKSYEGTYKDGELISSKEWNEDGSVKE